MGRQYEQDVATLAASEQVPWDALAGSRVVVTGATGLIGGLVARAALARNTFSNCDSSTMRPGATRVSAGIEVVLPVRNLGRARRLFGEQAGCELVPWDATSGEPPVTGACDFIVHCAANTDSRLMVEQPVETIQATVRGTSAMLELARAQGARLCVASSMEVYGAGSDELLDEHAGGALDAMSVRSSYPQAKQLAETLCAAYAVEYGVAACAARLAQTFGAGVTRTDRRAFAEFARCCLTGHDIALLTDGSKRNMYVSTVDAAAALLILAVRGQAGAAYNVANEATCCSILEMAQLVAAEFGPKTQVTRVVDDEAARRFAVSGSIRLDTSRVRELGWSPTLGLLDMFAHLIADWEPTLEKG